MYIGGYQENEQSRALAIAIREKEMTYTQHVRDSILPLSVADTLPKAFEEWRFTGHTCDHEEPVEICRLCGQEGLRYHFEIQNDSTHRTLDVGSHCILQFNVAVYDDGRRLSSKDAKRRLHKLVQKMRLDSCINALERLARTKSPNTLRRTRLLSDQQEAHTKTSICRLLASVQQSH